MPVHTSSLHDLLISTYETTRLEYYNHQSLLLKAPFTTFWQLAFLKDE